MSATVIGRINWRRDTDEKGHRDYRVQLLVKTTDPDDGPQTVFLASGAPAIGSSWTYGNDNDPYALCVPTSTCEPLVTREPNIWWILDQHFTTKPISRCQTSSITNPISEPQGLSGSFVDFTKRALKDRNGNPILNSAHQVYPFPLEIDDSRPNVIVEQNVSTLDLSTITGMRNTLNDATLWGLGARKIKLSRIQWRKRFYGSCTAYYTRIFEFDIKFDGWDYTDLLDFGTVAFDDELFTDNAANRKNPKCYKVVKDPREENLLAEVLLDGSGNILEDFEAPIYLPTVEIYAQSNFNLLGIPASL